MRVVLSRAPFSVIIGSIGCWLALASPASAQSVDEIIAKNLAAKGGVALLKQTISVRTIAKAVTPNGDVTITSVSKRPNLMRNEITGAGQSFVIGFDGTTAWVAPQGLPAKAMPAGPQTEIMKQTSQIDSPLLDYQAKGMKAELVGTESEGERKLHHLVLTPKTGPRMHYFIDAATGLESRLLIESNEGGQMTRMEIRFADYRTVDGRTVPFSTTQVVNGNEAGQITFESVEFNVPLDDSMFRMSK
jgi:outer membrane lipoprotein-sorting protein